MRRRNVDVAPTRVMAAIAHGTLSRGASIAFFVGRDKLTGWDVARHAREIDEPNPLRRLKLTATKCGTAPSRNQNCTDERLFKRIVFARYDRHHEKRFRRGGCVAARPGQFYACPIHS
jgi:hypothetical protein